ncbi:acyltransferase family protein [Streptomyces xiamenensis]|uniref:Acyltransferase 3 n=1 Tax=Streptomyces xiamenensis TaxID=408015 RepID=A0A0F7CNE4_9ACTN|nr:acyltransferase [Streptomyces xiamenensis]AKG42766.1 acyltransferase 3 [Streptomyces xiamenensis]
MTPDAPAPAAPPGRNPYVDLLRITAVGFVVVGHWLLTSISDQGGHLHGEDVVDALPWTQWLTLFFQVMPLIFLAGGYANAVSWSGHHARGESWGGWLADRARRLLVPTTVYVAVTVLAVVVCVAAGVPATVRDEVFWAVALHLWFLPMYLLLLALTPPLLALWRRLGLWLPLVFAALSAVVDVGVLGPGIPVIGWSNYLWVWGGLYLLGFAWRDGALTRPLQLWSAAAAAALWVLLVVPGPFPVSTIGVPGARVQNASPPSIALFAYSVVLIGLLLAAEDAVRRRLRHPRRVTAANAAAMPLYLWHMAPAMAIGAVLYPAGLLPFEPVGSGGWWLLRPVWVLICAALLIPLVLAMARLPHPPPYPTRTGWSTGPWLLLGAGLTAASFGLARLALRGFAPDGRLPAVPLLCYAVGVALLLAVSAAPRTGGGVGHSASA